MIPTMQQPQEGTLATHDMSSPFAVPSGYSNALDFEHFMDSMNGGDLCMPSPQSQNAQHQHSQPDYVHSHQLLCAASMAESCHQPQMNPISHVQLDSITGMPLQALIDDRWMQVAFTKEQEERESRKRIHSFASLDSDKDERADEASLSSWCNFEEQIEEPDPLMENFPDKAEILDDVSLSDIKNPVPCCMHLQTFIILLIWMNLREAYYVLRQMILSPHQI